MDDFGDFDSFSQYEVQGKPIKVHRNGDFENGKALFIQPNWTWDDLLCAGSQRLEMVPMAKRVYNADGTEIDDMMCIEEDDLLFFSSHSNFKPPLLNSKHGSPNTMSSGEQKNSFSGIVGGYRIGSFLGRGGFGEVRLGVHQKSEIGSLGDAERTTTEIHCLTALNHPHIIKLLRVLNEPRHVVLVFELLEGGDLFHYLKELPPCGMPEEEGCKLFTQILQGVGYAHNQHICHRDLKLENILLANKDDINDVKIADFGLSDFYRPGAMMKTSCGSISYLAPEVFRGTSNAGPPLDVWSLGVILFAILCGRLPFEGSDLRGTNRPRENVIRNRIMRCQYKLDDYLSVEVKDLIDKMLKLDPNERATIPEVFNHCWIRGTVGECDVVDAPSTPPKVKMISDELDQLTTKTNKPSREESIVEPKTTTVKDQSNESVTPLTSRKFKTEGLHSPTGTLGVSSRCGPTSLRNDRHMLNIIRSPTATGDKLVEKSSPRMLNSPIYRKGEERTVSRLYSKKANSTTVTTEENNGFPTTSRNRRRMVVEKSFKKRSTDNKEASVVQEKLDSLT